jgi:arabinofuranosyltransferase
LPAGLALVFGTAALRHGPRVVDDAYITFRYARNLAEGAGLVYNVGERVLGTSAPLYAILLAGLHALTGAAIPALAFALGAACLPACALLGYRLARRAAGPLPAALFVAAALSPQTSLEVFASGMETPLYLVGLLGAVELASRGRDAAAFMVAGALPFVHPDAVLLVPALAVAIGASRGRRSWRSLAVGLAPAAFAAAGLWLVYGSPLPHSVTAKRLAYAMPMGHAFSRLSETILEPLLAHKIHAPPLVAGLAATALGFILVFGRSALGALAALAFGGFTVLYVAALGVANPLVFEWYRPPLALASTYVIAACIANLPRTDRAAAALLLAGSAALHLVSFRPYDPSGREDVYARAAAVLALRPEETVAAPEIGALGWATRGRVLDTAGLVSPAALAWLGRPAGEGGSIPPRLVRETSADALVALDRFLNPALASDPGALAGWSEVARYPAHAFGSPGTVRVFRRAR